MKNEKKIIFFTTPAFGHINSTLPIIEKLVKQGNHVICYSDKQYKSHIDNIGAEFVEYKIDFNKDCLDKYTENLLELLKVLSRLNRQAYEIYVNEIDYNNVDLILYDSMCSFAKNISYTKNKKNICIQTTLAYNFFVFVFSNMFWNSIGLFLKNLNLIKQVINDEYEFRKKHGLPKFNKIDFFVNSGDKTIVLTPKEFQPFRKTFGKNFYFVGTTIKERLESQKNEYDTFDYYISFGSILEIRSELLDIILKLEEINKSKVAILLDKNIDKKNIKTYKFVQQLALLKNAKVFINHAGLNSIYEAIYLNKKQILIPMQEEQRFSAILCKNKKIGYYVKDYNKINKGIKYINKYNKNLQKYSKIIKSYDGTNLAFNIINNYIKENR